MVRAKHFTVASWLTLAMLLLCAAARADTAAPVDDAKPTAASDDAPRPARIGVQLSAGAGVGQRIVSLPTQLGLRKLDTSLYPALTLSLGVDGGIGQHGLLGVHIQYETSVGLTGTEAPANGEQKRSSLRSHRVEAGITAGVRFGAEHSASLRLFAGWSVRALRAVVDMSVPNYTLHGPAVRPELRIPFGDGALELLLAPEVQLIVAVNGDFQRMGATSRTGFAYAGQIALDVHLSKTLLATLAYREAHATLSAAWADKATDIERYITARIALSR